MGASTAPVSFLLTALALGLLVWISATEDNALGGAHDLYGWSELGRTLASQNRAHWLLGSVVARMCALVSNWFTKKQSTATLAAA
jgi:hypothetical protein